MTGVEGNENRGWEWKSYYPSTLEECLRDMAAAAVQEEKGAPKGGVVFTTQLMRDLIERVVELEKQVKGEKRL